MANTLTVYFKNGNKLKFYNAEKQEIVNGNVLLVDEGEVRYLINFNEVLYTCGEEYDA